MSTSLSASPRADYGGALIRCVAMFGRADQHSAGAEGAPYRLSIEVMGCVYCSSVERMRMFLPTCPILAMSRRLAICSDMERVASISDGGRSLARAILATTGRWSECAAPVKVVGGEPICCHLHTEAWAWV
eukprot:scaffold13984_cov117-Isochrysis_galbana.AAC.3